MLVLLLMLFIDHSSIDIKNAGVFAGKMCSDRRKSHGYGQEKRKALALLYLAFGPLPNAANSSDVPTEFTAYHNKDEVFEGNFCNSVNFLPSTKKTTEYSLKVSRPIYRY